MSLSSMIALSWPRVHPLPLNAGQGLVLAFETVPTTGTFSTRPHGPLQSPPDRVT